MRVVLALGGNALLRRGQPADAQTQRANVARAARAIAAVAADGHEVVVTHGNGPQVGLLALQSAAYQAVAPYPLDVLGAESEGMVGYLLEQALRTAGVTAPIATLLTQVTVEPADPAFATPTKPIGPVYARSEGAAIAAAHDWTMADDGGTGVRRVVASPEPQAILEEETIRLLADAGVVVICAGGGGIPVRVEDDGRVVGVEAVVDKDLAAALLAQRIDADLLVLLTDVAGVFDGWGLDHPALLRELPAATARAMPLAAGSMGPKVEAACRFAESGGRAVIGAMEDAAALVAGTAGTEVVAAGLSAVRR